MKLDKNHTAKIVFSGLGFLLSVLMVVAIYSHDKKQSTPAPEETEKSVTTPEKMILTGWSKSTDGDQNQVRYFLLDNTILCVESQRGGVSCNWESVKNENWIKKGVKNETR